MPEVTKKTIDTLKTEVSSCSDKISALQVRISTLVDENKMLENRVARMSKTIAEDIKYLYDKIQ